MSIEYSYSGPNFRGINKILKDALDEGFRYHQRVHLPKHFHENAPRRYQGAYAKRGARKNTTETWAHRWARMSNAEKKKIFDQQKLRRAGISARKKSRKTKLPLVVSGVLRRAVLKGFVKGVGPVAKRRAKIPAPHYLNFHRPGQIHKRSALQAVIKSENADFIKVVDMIVARELKKRPVKKKRSRGANGQFL